MPPRPSLQQLGIASMNRFVLTLAFLLAAMPALAVAQQQQPVAAPPNPAVAMATVDALRAEQKLREVQVQEYAAKTEAQIQAILTQCGPPCAGASDANKP